MSETKIARRMLASVDVGMSHAEKLMESDDEDVRIFALDVFIRLAEIEMALFAALGLRIEHDERNPLARRYRGEGGSIE